MNDYSNLFNDDPWEGLSGLRYPEGRRLYLNDSRFWISIDANGRLMFFIHDDVTSNIKILGNLNSLDICIDQNFKGATRLCCTLIGLDDDLKRKFSIVAKDVAHNCSSYSGEILLNKVLLRIKSWADFLKPTRGGLSHSEFVGFWGEMYVMSKYLLQYYSPFDAVKIWVGPDGKKQDITLNSIAIEIKTSMSGDPRSIKISSLDQLDKITPSLYLLHLVGSPSVDGKGISLKNMFENCLEIIKDDFEAETLFLNKVFQLYGKASSEQLDSSILVVSEKVFDVVDEFPSLTRKNIPLSIERLTYEILLSEISEFESKRSIEDIVKNG